MIRLSVRELEKRYGLEGIVYAKIIDVNGKVLMGIRNTKKVLQDYEDHRAYTCKESRVKGFKCKKAKIFYFKGTSSDEWKTIFDY